jgi:hypothetical protein
VVEDVQEELVVMLVMTNMRAARCIMQSAVQIIAFAVLPMLQFVMLNRENVLQNMTTPSLMLES